MVSKQIVYIFVRGTKEKDPDLIEQKNVLMSHIDTMFSYYGTELEPIKPKAYAWYTKSLPNSCQFRERYLLKLVLVGCRPKLKNYLIMQQKNWRPDVRRTHLFERNLR